MPHLKLGAHKTKVHPGQLRQALFGSRRSALQSLLTAAVLLTAAPALGDIAFWNGNSGEWTNPANWSTGVVPSAPDTVAVFQTGVSSPTSLITIASPVTVGQLTLDGALATYQFNAGSTTGSLTFAASTGPATILVTSSLGTRSATLTLATALTSNLLISNEATGALVFTGNLSGSGNLILNQAGEADLRGNNSSWNGNIALNAGLLSTVSGTFNSLGNPSTGTVTVSPGASVDITAIGGVATTQQFFKTFLLAGAGTTASPGALAYGATTTTLLGTIVLNGAAAFYAKSPTALLNIGDLAGTATTSSLTGSGPLIKSGAGILQINIPAGYAGGTIVSGGILQLGAAGSLVGTGAVTISSGAMLRLSKPVGNVAAADSVSPNSVILNGGTLSIMTDMSLVGMLSPASTSGLLRLDNAATFTAGGTNVIDFSNLTPGNTIRLGTSTATTLGSALSLIPDSSHWLHFGGVAGTLTINSNIRDVGAAPTNLEFGGPGITILASAESYTGATTIDGGITVQVTNALGLGSSSAGTVVNANGLLQILAPCAEPLTVNGGSLTVAAPTSGPILLVSGTAAFNTGSTTSTSTITISGGALTVSVPLTNNIFLNAGSASFSTGSAGASAPVIVNGGTLNVGTVISSPLTLNGGITNFNVSASELISLSGGTLNISTLFNGTITATGGLIKQSGSGSFADRAVILAGGRISLASNLPLGALLNPAATGGVVSLDNTGAYSAGTTNTLDFSVMPAGSGYFLGSSTVSSIAANVLLKPDNFSHTLYFGGAGNVGTLTVNSAITDFNNMPTNLAVVPNGLIILASSQNSYSGTTIVSGTLQVNDPSALGTGTGSDANGTVVNVGGNLITAAGVILANEKITANGGTLAISSGGPVQINGSTVISGTLTGNISGTGSISTNSVLLLSGTNTFTGQVNVLSGGNVTVNSPAALGDVNQGTTINTGGLLTMAAASSEPVTVAGGILTVTGPFLGPVTVNGGTANINAVSSSSLFLTAGVVYLNTFGSNSVTATGGTLYLTDVQHPQNATMSLSNTTLIGGGSVLVQGPVNSSGSVTITSNTYRFGTTAITFAGGIAGSGTLTLSPDTFGQNVAAVNVTGPLAFSGALVVNAGNISLADLNTSGILSLGGNTVTVNGSVHHVGTITATATSLLFNGPSLVVDGSFINQSSMTLNSVATISQFVLAAGSLNGAGTLNVSGPQLDFRGGYLNFSGSFYGVTSILKSTGGYAFLQQLPASFTGSVNVQAGGLVLSPSLNGSINPINVSGSGYILLPPFSTLVGGTYSNPIYLNSAPGPGNQGALQGNASFGNGGTLQITLNGAVDLGSQGSVVGYSNDGNGYYLTFNGPLTGGSLTVQGNPVFLTIASPANYIGPTLITGSLSTLYVAGNGRLNATPSITISGGQLELGNDGTSLPDRIPDTIPIYLKNGRVQLDDIYYTGTISQETLGSVLVEEGYNKVSVVKNSSNPALLSISTLTLSQGAVVRFGLDLGGSLTTDPRIFLPSQAATNYMGGAYTYAGSPALVGTDCDFVRYDGVLGVVPFGTSDYSSASETLWNNTTNAFLPGPGIVTLTASRMVNVIKFNNNQNSTLDLQNVALNVGGDGIILLQSSIVGGSYSHLTAGGSAAAATLYLYGGGGATGGSIAANIADNPGPDGLYAAVPGGPEDLDNGSVTVIVATHLIHFSGTNTYTGLTYVDGAALFIDTPTAASGSGISLSAGNYNVGGSFTVQPGAVTIHSGSIGGSGAINATSYLVESGSITIPMIGSGPFTKITGGTATLTNISAYSGSISVLGGTCLIPGGTITNSVLIQGGAVSLGSASSIRGPVDMENGSTLTISSGALDWAPSPLTVGGVASLVVPGSYTIAGTNDPFTDTSDSTRHINLFTGYFTVSAGVKNLAVLNATSAMVATGAALSVASLQLSGTLTVNGNVMIRANAGSDAYSMYATGNGATPLVGTSAVTNLTLGAGAHLDIGNNALIIEATAGTKAAILAAIAGDVGAGAITSSTAASNPAYGLEVVDNGALGASWFGGVAVDSNSIIVTQALLGDGNLDGVVNPSDLLIWANNFNNSGVYSVTGGDFNLDGVVNPSDLLIWANNLNNSIGGNGVPSMVGGSVVATPEPGGLAVAGMGAMLLVRRRRKVR